MILSWGLVQFSQKKSQVTDEWFVILLFLQLLWFFFNLFQTPGGFRGSEGSQFVSKITLLLLLFLGQSDLNSRMLYYENKPPIIHVILCPSIRQFLIFLQGNGNATCLRPAKHHGSLKQVLKLVVLFCPTSTQKIHLFSLLMFYPLTFLLLFSFAVCCIYMFLGGLVEQNKTFFQLFITQTMK